MEETNTILKVDNDSELKWQDGAFNDPSIIITKAICFILSVSFFLLAIAKVRCLKLRNIVGIFMLSSLLLLDDVIYFICLFNEKNHPIVEYCRTFIPVLAGSLFTLLSLIRFQEFSFMKQATWYTKKVRNILLAVSSVTSFSLLLWVLIACIEHPIHEVPLIRKIAVSINVTFLGGLDLVFTSWSLFLIYQLFLEKKRSWQSDGDSSSKHLYYDKAFFKIRLTMVACSLAIISFVVGVLIFLIAEKEADKMICHIFIRLYKLLSFIVWILIVEILHLTRHFVRQLPSEKTFQSNLADPLF